MANCLYNGIELLDINTVWINRETHPNAIICQSIKSGMYMLYIGTLSKNYMWDTDLKRLFRMSGTGVTRPQAYYYLHNRWVFGWDNTSIMPESDAHVVIWSSDDLYTSESLESIYMVASLPITMDNTVNISGSWFNAYILGQRLRPRLVEIGTYLYTYGSDTTPMPALPNGIATLYDFAALCVDANGEYRLYLSTTRMLYTQVAYSTGNSYAVCMVCGASSSIEYVIYNYNKSTKQFMYQDTYRKYPTSRTSYTVAYGNTDRALVWTNHDIYRAHYANEYDRIYFDASKPKLL